MKKALVLLLILAVAGGVFAKGSSQAAAAPAEGEFSWSGGVDIGGKIDFNDGGAKNALTKPNGNIKGHNDLTYTKGGLDLGIGFETNYWDADDDDAITAAKIGFTAGYTGENWGAKIALPFITIDRSNDGNYIEGSIGTGTGSDDVYAPQYLSYFPDTLWGYYAFLDNTLRFDVSFAGGGNGVWCVSDIVKDAFWDAWDRIDDGSWGGGFQFTYTGIEGLSFGVQFPFQFFNNNDSFVDNTLFNPTIGAAFNKGPIGASFMIAFRPKYNTIYYGNLDPADPDYDPSSINRTGVSTDVHLGFKYTINDKMSAKLDAALGFTGTKDAEDKSINYAAIGFNFDFASGPFGAGLTFVFHDITDKYGVADDDWNGRALEINPYASYQITDALGASLGLTLGLGLGDLNKNYDKGGEKLAYLAIEPGLSWAVGAGASMNFGYCVKFSFDSDRDDKLLDHNITLGFSWSW